MPLKFEDGKPFAQGVCSFLMRPATDQELISRIFIEVQIEGVRTEVVVDTGGAYLVCNPEIADLLDLDPAAALHASEIEVRGRRTAGDLHRLYLTFLSEEGGENLRWEVTAFVPRPRPTQSWEDVRQLWEGMPSFIGLTGCLEQVRFAVDPAADLFYFGSSAVAD